jgi:hypothetical protein
VRVHLGRIGKGVTFLRKHAAEPNSKMTLLSQDPSPTYLTRMDHDDFSGARC